MLYHLLPDTQVLSMPVVSNNRIKPPEQPLTDQVKGSGKDVVLLFAVVVCLRLAINQVPGVLPGTNSPTNPILRDSKKIEEFLSETDLHFSRFILIPSTVNTIVGRSTVR